MNGSDQRVEQDRIVHTRAQIDPGVLIQKSQRRFCAGEQNGNDGKALATAFSGCLTLQREILLSLLPRAHFALPNTDSHCSTLCKGCLQCLQP